MSWREGRGAAVGCAVARTAPVMRGAHGSDLQVNSLVMWIGGLLAAILAAVFAVPLLIDWNGYRGVIEEEATRVIGREVRIGGKVNLRLLPAPYISFEKLRIADTRPGSGRSLFRAEAFTMWLSVPPLLKGDLEVRRVALTKPELNLAIDADGRGSWTELDLRAGALPFTPGHVALQAVEIEDGRLLIDGPGGEIAKLEDVDGELSAEALSGPMRFAGTLTAGGVRQDVRVATARADADGSVRFKASAHDADRSWYDAQLDGQLLTPFDVARIEGDVVAKVALPLLPAQAPGAASPARDAAKAAPAPAPAPAVELRGRLDAGAQRIALTAVSASIENVAQPQLLAGEASLTLTPRRRLDVTATSRWLDFDRLSGSGARAAPMATVALLGRGIGAMLPSGTDFAGRLRVDLLTLGGEGIGNLDIAMERDVAGALQLKHLFAALPAGGRLVADGTIDAGAGAEPPHRAAADVVTTLEGPSLKRLLQWAAPDLLPFTPDTDGPIAFDARVRLDGDTVTVSEARVQVAGSTLSGAWTLPRREDGHVDVVLEADTLDWGWLSRMPLSREGVLGWLSKVSTSVAPGGAPIRRDISVKMQAAVLRGRERELRDVVVDAALKEGRLALERLSFEAGQGLEVALKGHLDLAADASPGVRVGAPAGAPDGKPGTGRIEGTVAVRDGAALERLLALADAGSAFDASGLKRLTPLRLATTVELGARGGDSGDIHLDGAAAGGRLMVDAALDGGLDGWRDRPLDLAVSASDLPVARLVGLLTGRPGDEPVLGSLALKAVGTPSSGLVADVAISGDGLSIAYNGKATLRSDAGLGLDGSLELAAERLSDVLAATASGMRVAGLGHAVTGSLGLTTQPSGGLRLTPAGLTVAGASVDGTLLARPAQGGVQLSGELRIDRMALAGMLASLTEAAPAPAGSDAGSDAGAPDGGGAPWPEQPFAPDALERAAGSIGIAVKQLVVAPDMTLGDARLIIAMAPGKLTATIGSAELLGGTLSGVVEMSRARAGIAAKLSLAAKGAQLAALAREAGGGHAALGTADVSISASSLALSPRGLVSGLRGAGEVALHAAEVEGFSPDAVRQTVLAAFERQIGSTDAALTGALLERLKIGMLPLGSRSVGIDVGDGAVRVAPISVETPSGRTEVLSTLDLGTLAAETEWRITAGPVTESGKPWPTVSVYFVGPLGQLQQAEPRLALGALQRELVVRRMEFEVDTLERLRREDEERARRERERQQAVAAERERLAAERKRAEEEERRRRLQALPPAGPGERIEVVPLPLPAMPPPTPGQQGAVAPTAVPQPAPVERPAQAAPPVAPALSPAQADPAKPAPQRSVERRTPWSGRISRPPTANETTRRGLDPNSY